MYCITVMVGPACFQLLYKKEEPARDAQTRLGYNPSTAMGSVEWIALTDDFGHEMAFERKNLSGFIFEDMEQTKLAHVERALHQQKMQNLAQKTAQSDPALRAASMMNGPAMLSPFSGPRQN